MATHLVDLVRAAAAGGPRATRPAARLMSIVSDEPQRLPELYHAAQAEPAIASRLALPRALVGITGSPGSGKSTLTDALIREYRRRSPSRRLGVVAVDPSSPFTGGAVLGDRVRMMRHATDPDVFVRSMASRGHLGGLALGVKGVIRVMGLVGCDVVFVETVGVGQSEVEVAGVADVVLIVLAPGLGDSVQLLKAGLMEIGDVFVVNKADRPDASRLHAELLAMLGASRGDDGRHHAAREANPDAGDLAPWLSRRPGTLIDPRTFLVSGEQGQGVADLVGDLEALTDGYADRWQAHRLQTIEQEIRDAVVEDASRRLRDALASPGAGERIATAVLQGRASVERAAADLLALAARAAARPTEPGESGPRE
jgi:LAO/AO transport system kinase